MAVQNEIRPLTNRRGRICLWLVLFLALGYPIQAAIPVLLHIPSTPINVAFRVAYSFVSLLLILASLGKQKNISRGAGWLLFFWVLYSIRLIADISYRGIMLSTKDALFMYSMAFGNCLLPMVAIIFTANNIHINNLYKKLFGIVVVSNLVLTLLIFVQNGGLTASLLDSRADIIGQNSDEHVINTIVIGFYGSVLFILSCYFLMFFRYKNILERLVMIFFCGVGLLNLVLAASRGPFLTAVVTLVFLFYFKYKTSNTKISFLFKTITVIVLAGYLLTATGFMDKLFERSTLFNRLSNFGSNLQSGVKEERDYEYASAFDQFYNNPIVGDQYVTTYDSFYPHNVYLEVLMSLGVVGGVVFLMLHFEIIKKVILIFKKHYFLYFSLLLVVIICFLSAITSGGIALNPGIWAITALFLSVSYKRPQRAVV
jgi:hypothetical protein